VERRRTGNYEREDFRIVVLGRRRLTSTAGGEWPRMALSKLFSRCSTSINLESRASATANLNTLNRRMRTRMSGGVGGK
jgi:hypothetical protein